MRVPENELVWVEVYEHHLHYKTAHDVLRGYGTLKEVEARLPENVFFRVNNQTILNLRYVQRISGNLVTAAGRSFEISRMRKKEFLAQFHRYGVNQA